MLNKYHLLIPTVFLVSFVGFYFNDTSEHWQNDVKSLCFDKTMTKSVLEIDQCNSHNKDMFWFVILYQSGIVTALFSIIWIVIVIPYLKERVKH